MALPLPGLRKFISDIRYGSPSICTFNPLRKSPVRYVATCLSLLRLAVFGSYGGYMEIVALPPDSVGGGHQVAGTLTVPLRGLDGSLPNDGTRSVPATWQAELRRAIREASQLLAALELPDSLLAPASRAAQSFPLFAPWPFIGRMAKGDAADPLLLQVLPQMGELDSPPGYSADP